MNLTPLVCGCSQANATPLPAPPPVRVNKQGVSNMINRLQKYMQPEPECAPEYFLVRGAFGYAFVSRETARCVMRQMQRWLQPRWIRFTDLSGSEICVPTRAITLVGEATPAQREFDRQLRKLLDKEDEDWS